MPWFEPVSQHTDTGKNTKATLKCYALAGALSQYTIHQYQQKNTKVTLK